jgi:flagellin
MSISLSTGLRTALYSAGDIQTQINTSNQRLATGKKVNSALDNARAYFGAQAFTAEARGLNGLLEGLTQGRQVIDKSTKAIDSAIKFLESADALAKSAQTSSSATDRIALRDQAVELLNQAVKLFSDSGFAGKTPLLNDLTPNATTASSIATLTAGTAAEKAAVAGATLDIQTNTATTGFTKITVSPVDVRFGTTTANGGLGIALAATNGIKITAGVLSANTAATDWDVATAGSQAQIDSFRTVTATAINTLRQKSATIATQGSVIDIRIGFTRDTARINNQAADDLVLADINEEGVNLSALQTKQQLAVQALSLASRADQAILRLF